MDQFRIEVIFQQIIKTTLLPPQIRYSLTSVIKRPFHAGRVPYVQLPENNVKSPFSVSSAQETEIKGKNNLSNLGGPE